MYFKFEKAQKCHHISFIALLHNVYVLGKLTPSPIRKEMEPIVSLFQTNAVRKMTHPTGPYKDERINVTNLVNVVIPAYNDYCSQMPGTNCHIGCPVGVALKNNGELYVLVLQSFPYNEHVVYCSDTSSNICLHFSKGKI